MKPRTHVNNTSVHPVRRVSVSVSVVTMADVRLLLCPGEGALCSIPIENILAVERLEEESFKMKNVRGTLSRSDLTRVYAATHCIFPFLQMFQVIQPERALYIQANNCVEARDWIDILTKVSQCNRKRLSTYHPSAYLNGHWLCCKLSADAAPGCTPCTG